MSPEPFVSRAKALPAKKSEKGYGDEKASAVKEMSSLNEAQYVALGAVMTVLMIMGFALQIISFFILLKPPFRKFDLPPHFLNVAL